MANYNVKANPDVRPPGPITDADIENIRDCFRRELSVNQTARELGLSSYQISTIKKKFGLTSVAIHDNSAGSEAFATKARRERHARREKWQKIAERMLDDLERDLFTDKRDVVTILRGIQGIEGEELVTKVPSRDLRERLAAVNVAELAIQKIDALEDDQGLARGLSMLETFSQAADRLANAILPAPRAGLIQE